MIYVELQFDPDEAYLRHEKELDNPSVIQALTRYKQNLAGDFAEAFQSRGERLFICSKFVYELIQLGHNLEYRQVSFANLARSMTHNELLNALQCIQNSCISLVDTALMAVDEIRRTLPLQGASVLFLELERDDMDRQAAKVQSQALEVFYAVAWKSEGSGITADVAVKYGLRFDTPEAEIEGLVRQVKAAEIKAEEEEKATELRWPVLPGVPGREYIDYAFPIETIMEDKYSRSKTHQFLKTVEQKAGAILNMRVKLRPTFEYKTEDEKEDKTFQDIVNTLMKQQGNDKLVVPINDKLYLQLFGIKPPPHDVYWKPDEENDGANEVLMQMIAQPEVIKIKADFKDDAAFFEALGFRPLGAGGGEEKEPPVEESGGALQKDLNVVFYNSPDAINFYFDIQQYTLQAYKVYLYLAAPGEELNYDWNGSGVTTDVVVVPGDFSDQKIKQIGRAFRPTKIIKKPSLAQP